MKRYQDLSGHSGVVAYEAGTDWIKVKFEDGGLYLYTRDSTGPDNIEHMKMLAATGRGLATFIVQHVRTAYAQKLGG